MDLSKGIIYVILDKNGKILSLGPNNEFIYKDISEIKHITDAFTFWCCDIIELELYIIEYEKFLFPDKQSSFEKLDFQDITFLEIKEDDTGNVYFC